MRKKYYDNEGLMDYFEKWVGKMKVDDVYKPLLIDILLRRAHEFELEPKDIQQDMQSLMDNLKCIEIKTLPKNYKTLGGLYNSATKTITLNARTLDQMRGDRYNPKLYEILTHEVYHALSRDEKGRDRLSSVNIHSGKYNYSLLEVIVEKAADRCVYPRGGQTAPYYNQNTYGYTDITFLTDALAATYGVAEKDFLKNAIMGRRRLISFLSYQANEDPKETESFLDSVELNFTKLHEALYPDKILRRKPTPEEYERKIAVVKRSMANIYNWCEVKFAERIENTPLHGLRQAERFENEAKFNHNRLTYVMEDALYRFSNKYRRPDIYNDVSREVDYAIAETTDRISDIDAVIRNYSMMSIPEAITLINESRRGNLSKYPSFIRRFDIALSRNKLFPENARTRDEYYDSDFGTSTWENDAVSEYIARNLPEVVKRGNTVVNLIGAMLPVGRKSKQLLQEGREPEKIHNEASSFGALPKEVQDRINSTTYIPKQREERQRVKTEKQFEEK